MSNQQAIINLIKEISGQANVLIIPRVFIKLTGDVKAALFISQCIYWSDKTKRKDGYFYKSYDEWKEEIGLTREEIDRIRKTQGRFLETKLIRANGAPTTHWCVKLEEIANAVQDLYVLCETHKSDLCDSHNSDLCETHKSLTETTTEITINQQPPNGGDCADTFSENEESLEVVRLYEWGENSESIGPKPKKITRPVFINPEHYMDDSGDDELKYVEPGDEFGDSKAADPKWRHPDTDFQKTILAICRTKYFQSGEKSKLKIIERSMGSSATAKGITGEIKRWDPRFVDKMLDWGRTKNKGTKLKITVEKLLTALENDDNWTRWIAEQNPKEVKREYTAEDYDRSPYTYYD